MYPVIEINGLTMNDKMLASDQIRACTEPYTDLKQQKKFDDIGNRRKYRKKVCGSWTEDKKSTETHIEDKNKVGKISQEEPTGSCGCHICGKEFRRKDSLKYHINYHNTENKKDIYECFGCNVGFKKRKDKQEHELKCETLSQVECCFCELSCDTPKELRFHENTHKPIRKTNNLKNICICIDCKKAFDSIFSLKVHMQRDHKNLLKLEGKTEALINTKEGRVGVKQEDNVSDLSVDLDISLNDVSNLTNQTQTKSVQELFKPSTAPYPQGPDNVNHIKDKPFKCWKCDSRYKYEKSKIKHELKYHATCETPTKLNQQSEKNISREIKTSQVFNQDGSPGSVSVSSVDEHIMGRDEEGGNIAKLTDEVENMVHTDNNNIIPVDNIKNENGCLLPIVDVSVDGLAGNGIGKKAERDQQFSTRSPPNRQPIIKKKCIGCDKVFDGLKDRDEHELRCCLNYFNRVFNCMFCDLPFSKPKALRKHENKHRPARKTKKYKNRCVCIECNKTFDAVYSLRVHMKKLHRKCHATPFENKPFACRICDARFKYENSKYKHEMRYHSIDMDKTMVHSIGENMPTNFKPNKLQNSNDVSVMCKMEKNGPQYKEDANQDWTKEEPEGNLRSEGNLVYITENEVVSPVCIMKEEATAAIDESLVNPRADSMVVKIEEGHKVSSSTRKCDRRKRKAKQPAEKKVKKQKVGPYVCNNCEAKFNSPQGLWLHSYHQNMRTKRLSCIGCGRSFKGEKETEEHELKCNLNHNEYNFNCMFCDESFGTPKLLRNHELEHRPRRRTKNHKCVCINCRKPFDSIHSLKEHVREYHNIKRVKIERHERKEYTPLIKRRNLSMEEMMSCYVLLNDICEITTKKGKTKTKLCRTESKRTETLDRVAGNTDCLLEAETNAPAGDGCNKGNLTTCNVDVNIKKETTCNTAVYDMSGGERKEEDIKSEILVGLVETPACLVEAELANPDAMEQENGTGSFQCGKCDSKFDSYGKLRYHSYSHRQRTKRLLCIGCGVGFEQSNDRDRHELACDVNLTNGQFSCIFCELPFATPQSLRNHEKKHRPPKRYKRYRHMCLCAECDKAFDAVFTLKIHIRHMHRGSKEKVKVKEEIEDSDVNFESDLTFEEYKFDGDLKVERLH